MSQTVRPATPGDIPRLIELLLLDAAGRHAADPTLWKMVDDAPAQIEKALGFALGTDPQPFRQFWHVSDHAGEVTGVIHSMLLPVPPIYAGPDGSPGLILPDSLVAPDAPEGTLHTLVDAAENALRDAGAKILLSSFVTGQDWRRAYQGMGYEPLTLYLSRAGLGDPSLPAGIRPASDADIPGIVTLSAENRQVLYAIDRFWEPHPDADARFSNWMRKSLTLQDRDMLVKGSTDKVEGYVIAQPASRLHFPPAHDISGTGVIDDYYHPELVDPASLANAGEGAITLLRAAEAGFSKRGMDAAFVVCPARWYAKIAMLESAGYSTAMIWLIKR